MSLPEPQRQTSARSNSRRAGTAAGIALPLLAGAVLGYLAFSGDGDPGSQASRPSTVLSATVTSITPTTTGAAIPTPSSSPSPSATALSTPEEVAHQYASLVSLESGVDLQYAIVETSDIEEGPRRVASIFVLKWPDDMTKAFDKYRAVRELLRTTGIFDLERVGFDAWASAVTLKAQDTERLFVVPLRDYEHVPGRHQQDYIELVLTNGTLEYAYSD